MKVPRQMFTAYLPERLWHMMRGHRIEREERGREVMWRCLGCQTGWVANWKE